MNVERRPTDPSTWAPLQRDQPGLTLTMSDAQIPDPQLPDGHGMSLADWVAVVNDRRGELLMPERDHDGVANLAWRGDAMRLAHRLTTTQVLPAALAEALRNTLRQTPAADATVGGQQRLAWESIVGMLLAAGAPVSDATVLNALENPNPILALRVLRAWPTGAPREAFEGAHPTYMVPTTWLHTFLESPRRLERANVLEALLATGHPLDVGPDGPDNSLVEMAALNDDVASAHRLIQAGAPVNVAHRTKGTTALSHALAHGSLAMIDLLLSHGATVSALPTSLLEALVAPEVVDSRNLATVQALDERRARGEVRPDGQPWWTPAEEARALAALESPSAHENPTLGQDACKNWLEARALDQLLTNISESTPTLVRGTEGARRRL